MTPTIKTHRRAKATPNFRGRFTSGDSPIADCALLAMLELSAVRQELLVLETRKTHLENLITALNRHFEIISQSRLEPECISPC